MRAAAARADDDFDGGMSRGMLLVLGALRGLLIMVLRRPRDSIAAGLAGFAALAILINALFMQSGPHPAPMFSNRPVPQSATLTGADAALAPQRPEAAKPRTDIIAEIQRELMKRGFFVGPADGNYGPQTDAAIRDFEQAAGLRPSAEPNDVLLATIQRSSIKAQPAATPARSNDPIAALLAPSPRIVAVQRALTDFGYGPVKPSGAYDADTRNAIERFEKARHRPVTGQISDQLVRDLAALTGRPLE